MPFARSATIPVVLLLAASAGAQAPPIALNTRVRAWSTDQVFRNHDTRIIGSRGDTLVFQDGPPSNQIAIRRGSLTRLDVRTRKSGSVKGRVVRGAAAGAGIGVLAGLAGAGLYIARAESRGTCGYENSCYWTLYLVPVPALVVGGISGGLAGRSRSYTWVSVADPGNIQLAVSVPARRP